MCMYVFLPAISGDAVILLLQHAGVGQTTLFWGPCNGVVITRVKVSCGELDHDACRFRKAKSRLRPAHPWGYNRVVKDLKNCLTQSTSGALQGLIVSYQR